MGQRWCPLWPDSVFTCRFTVTENYWRINACKDVHALAKNYEDAYMKRMLPALVFFLGACPALAFNTDRTNVREFIDRMVEEHSYDRDSVTRIIAAAKFKESILEAISRPAEKTLQWHEYRDIFLTGERIRAGADFWREHCETLERISNETGVSVEILVGIIGVETYYGRITGNYRVLDALATLAFDYPPRSRFFTKELEQFLLLIREEGMDAADATGSYAGAMGRPQFMPSSYRAYAVDSTEDGKRDIWTNWTDVIGSVANYFVRHGWAENREVVAAATLSTKWQGDTPENTCLLYTSPSPRDATLSRMAASA